MTTTDVIRFDFEAAYAAQSRSDDGDTLLPGDAELIEALEFYCNQSHYEFEIARYAQEQDDYFASQCAACGPEGSTGPVCEDCFIPADEISEVAA